MGVSLSTLGGATALVWSDGIPDHERRIAADKVFIRATDGMVFIQPPDPMPAAGQLRSHLTVEEREMVALLPRVRAVFEGR